MGFRVFCHLASILRITGFIPGLMGVEVGGHNQEWVCFRRENAWGTEGKGRHA